MIKFHSFGFIVISLICLADQEHIGTVTLYNLATHPKHRARVTHYNPVG
ncbi:hypothetical protein [Leptothermofonsia sp. ETS-13]